VALFVEVLLLLANYFFAQIEEPGTPTRRFLDRSHEGVLTPPDFAGSIIL